MNGEMTAKEKLINYLDIFWTMFKIGITTFGGGYAMVAIIDRELGDRKHWIEKEELLNYIAIAQITPGIIAVNVSTFVGRKQGGVPGAIFATLGVVTPSIIIIMIIATLLTNFADNETVRHAFAGIRVCVCVLIINATIGFIKKTVVDLLTIVIFICVFVTAAFTRIETVYIVLAVLLISVISTILFHKKDTAGGKAAASGQTGDNVREKRAGKQAVKPMVNETMGINSLDTEVDRCAGENKNQPAGEIAAQRDKESDEKQAVESGGKQAVESGEKQAVESGEKQAVESDEKQAVESDEKQAVESGEKQAVNDAGAPANTKQTEIAGFEEPSFRDEASQGGDQ